MAPNCALDEAGLRRQYARYRRAGEGASLVCRHERRLVVDLDVHLDQRLVDELIAVERECCPFFGLLFEPLGRRLTVTVAHAEHEPALDAVACALGLEEG
jgi:hypothetical protein